MSHLNPSQVHNVSVNTYIDKSNPDTATHTDTSMVQIGVADKLRTILEFPISDIDPHQTISSAILTLNIETPPTASMNCSAHILLRESWSERAATWNNYAEDSKWETPGGDIYFDTVQDSFTDAAKIVEQNSSYKLDVGLVTGVGGTTGVPSVANPGLVFLKCETANDHYGVFKTASMSGAVAAFFGTGAPSTATNEITALSSTGFDLGAGANSNTTSHIHSYMAFADPTKSFFTEGTYTGSTKNQEIFLPFKPGMVWVKRQNSTDSAVFKTYAMRPEESHWFQRDGTPTPTGNMILNFSNNSFTIGKASNVNISGSSYWYVAWADTVVESATYTGIDSGNSNFRTIPSVHPLDMVMVRKRDASSINEVWYKTTSHATGAASDFVSTQDNEGASLDGRYIGQLFSTNGFQVGTQNSVNAGNSPYVWAGLFGIPSSTTFGKVTPLHGRLPDVVNRGYRWQVENGSWGVKHSTQRAYCSTTGTGFNLAWIDYGYSGTTGMNVQAEIDIIPGPGIVPTGQGVCWRFNDLDSNTPTNGNFYFARFTESASGLRDKLEIKKTTGATQTSLGSSPYSFDWSQNITYRFTILLSGNNYSIWVNDTFIDTITDTLYPYETKFGIFVGSDLTTEFDNIKIRRSITLPFTITTSSGAQTVSGIESLIRQTLDLGYGSLRLLLKQTSQTSPDSAVINCRFASPSSARPTVTINHTEPQAVATRALKSALGSYIIKSSDEFKSADRPSFISLGAGTDSTSDPHTHVQLVQDKGRVPICGTRKVSESFLGLTTGFSGADIAAVDYTPDRIYVTGPYTATECGYAKELRWYGSGLASQDNSYRAVIYEDAGGEPNNLIGASSIMANSLTVNIWHRTFFEEKVHIEKSKSYWIGLMTETEATTGGPKITGAVVAGTARKTLWAAGLLELMNPPRLFSGAGGTVYNNTETFDMYLTYTPCLPTIEVKARATTGSNVLSSVTELGLHTSDSASLIITSCDSASGFTTSGAAAPYSVPSPKAEGTGSIFRQETGLDYIQFTNPVFDWSGYGTEDKLELWMYSGTQTTGYTIVLGQDSSNYWSWEDTTTVFPASTWADVTLQLNEATSTVGNPGLTKNSIYLKVTSSTSHLDNIRLTKSDSTMVARSELSTPSSHTSDETKIITFTLQATPSEELT